MKKGLTLIELLIVIALIGILAMAITGNFLTSIKRGRDARRKSDLKAVQNCMEQYFSVNNSTYEVFTGTLTTSVIIHCGALIGGPTLSVQDPVNATVGSTNYRYTITSTISNFTISANLEAPNGSEPNPFTVSNQQ